LHSPITRWKHLRKPTRHSFSKEIRCKHWVGHAFLVDLLYNHELQITLGNECRQPGSLLLRLPNTSDGDSIEVHELLAPEVFLGPGNSSLRGRLGGRPHVGLPQ
jgi:hypothetical protein